MYLHHKSANKHTLLPVFFLYCIANVWAATADDVITDKISHAITAYTSGNYDQALIEFLPLAKQGNAESQYYTGLIYSTDKWPKRDPSLALSYLLSAADQSYTLAMWQIGHLYNSGDGVKQDLLVALDWYRKSEKMEPKPPKPPIVKVHDGVVSPHNWPDEIRKLNTQATSGDVDAQYRMASVYDTGILIPEDASQAF